MKITKTKINLLLLALLTISFTSCHNRENDNSTALTGWSSKDKTDAGFSDASDYRGQETPPGMVLIEGGTFTMGHVQDDVLFDWNTTPVQMQVRSFYLDEVEVTNAEYLFYLDWLQKVFPSGNDESKHIYTSALPDTLVWRNTLGANELLTQNYLRHPSYRDYPVVGVSWKQANRYCVWRSDRVSEKTLFDKGVMENYYEMDSMEISSTKYFNADTFIKDPFLLFEGDSAVYEPSRSRDDNIILPKVSDGIISPTFRLPSEAEWEYAAKADVGNREYNNIRGRKKYAWDGKYTRNSSRRFKGDQLANFKQGRGDYSGVAGWSNDGGDITMPIRQYSPNAYGLYDMSGNVAEWVADVYRPIIDTDANDMNYYRGNVFTKPMIDDEGKVVVVDVNTIAYDTLPNGQINVNDLPGSVKYVPITKDDAYMRNNYEKAYNVDNRDGDLASTKMFEEDEEELDVKPRMYNSPVTPTQIGESGLRIKEYDEEYRTTLISDQTRVYKGGSWQDREYWLDPAQRRFLPEYMATSFIGFRCATDKLGPMTYKRRTRYTEKKN
ncbi:gliding motility lipoprotein GldJ [Urechidicola sp. KH5]